jgi:hypothetical protein
MPAWWQTKTSRRDVTGVSRMGSVMVGGFAGKISIDPLESINDRSRHGLTPEDRQDKPASMVLLPFSTPFA